MMLCVAQKEEFSAFILTEDSQEQMVGARSNCCVQEVLRAPEKPVRPLLCPSAHSAIHALSCPAGCSMDVFKTEGFLSRTNQGRLISDHYSTVWKVLDRLESFANGKFGEGLRQAAS